MTSRSILSFYFVVVLSVLFLLPKGACALEPAMMLGAGSSTNSEMEKNFEEKIISLISKRMDLPSVRSKLEKPNGKFVPVYGYVLDVNDERFLDVDVDDNLFASENLFDVLNRQLLLKNENLLKKASTDVRNTYKRLMNRFNFISLEWIKIHVDYFYDRIQKKWVRPVAGDSIVTMTMIVKSGYFLYQDRDSIIDIRRYGYYIPGSNVKRIFFGDGYSEVLQGNPDEVSPDAKKVLPYKLVEKISQNKKVDDRNRKKVRNLLKNRDFAAIPFVVKDMDKYCETNSCSDTANYRRYLNTLELLYKGGVFSRY
jgi:hypothetical protein